VDVAVAQQHGAAGEGCAGEPAEDRRLGPGALERLEEELGGKAEWVAEGYERLAGPGGIFIARIRKLLREPEEAEPLAVALGAQVHCAHLRSRQAGGPDDDPGALLHLASLRQGAPGPAADQVAGSDPVLNLGQQPLRQRQVRARGEDEAEIAVAIESGTGTVGCFGGGADRVELLGEADGDRGHRITRARRRRRRMLPRPPPPDSGTHE
jgi:hypothetical protein